VSELVGANTAFVIDQISDQIRDLVVSRFGDLLGEKMMPILQLAANYRELATKAATKLAPDLARYGIELTQPSLRASRFPTKWRRRSTADSDGRHRRYGRLRAASGGGRDRDSRATPAAAEQGRDRRRNRDGADLAGAAGERCARLCQARRRPAGGRRRFQRQVGLHRCCRDAAGTAHHAALEQRARAGELTADTLVWRDGMAEWGPASRVPELKAVLAKTK